MPTEEPTSTAESVRSQWLASHLCCTKCGCSPLEFASTGCRCARCGAAFPVVGGAVNFIDEFDVAEFQLDSADHISAHPFDENALAIIDHVGTAGGMILDCGSGQKAVSLPNVIQLEIEHYPNVDVLAVNQRLPFVDDSFDAVFSLDVLEHVDQPFTC